MFKILFCNKMIFHKQSSIAHHEVNKIWLVLSDKMLSIGYKRKMGCYNMYLHFPSFVSTHTSCVTNHIALATFTLHDF